MSGHAGEGGLQRHSVGEQYPLVSVVQTNNGKKTWTLLDARTSFEVVGIPTREILDWFVAHILIFKLRLEQNWKWNQFSQFCIGYDY